MLTQPSMPARLISEFVGTFTLIAVGVGAALTLTGDSALLGIAFAHGLAIAVMVTATGHVSGAHFNPAVTIAMLLMRKIEAGAAAAYIVAQLAGATVAALFLKAVYPNGGTIDDGAGVPLLADGLGTVEGIALEALLTFFLVWVIFAVAVDRDGAFFKVAGLPIGFVITMDILMGGTLTGAAMNPARSFGPALAGGVWTDWIVYWVGPIIGAVLAAAAYMYVVRPRLVDDK